VSGSVSRGAARAHSAFIPYGAPKVRVAAGRHRGHITRVITELGAVVRRQVERLGTVGEFIADSTRALSESRTWTANAMQQARRLGVDSLPIALMIAAFTGIVLALLANYSLTGAVPLYFVGVLLEKTITLELTPVLSGLALAGRVGANIAAEIGTMRVTEQVDALETLAYDPYAYLVVPRVIAGTIMFPIVVGLAMVVALVFGYIAARGIVGLTASEFQQGVQLFYTNFDIAYGLVKSASFGFAVSLIGCIAGLRAKGGAEGVGRAATDAVVYSAVMILVLDAFWAMTWLQARRA
jgi:phospholipid/cholesterol/gamma-HCH transport system permease protein